VDGNEIRQTILDILQPLEKSEMYGSLVLGFGGLAAIGFVLVLDSHNYSQSPVFIIFGTILIIVTCVVGLKILTSSSKRGVKSYNEAFPPNSKERGVADHILFSLKAPRNAVEMLCAGLGVTAELKALRAQMAKAGELRLKTEAEKSNNYLKVYQKNLPITDTFKCGSCNANTDWVKGAKDSICHNCNATLLLPSNLSCPSCGGRNIQIVSKPRHKAALAALLMGGPGGLVAGTVIDSVLGDLEQDLRQKIKNPVFRCESCKTLWGIKLPFETHESEDEISSDDSYSVVLADLEKLNQLKKQGSLTKDEYIAAKKKLLG
jgi:hypothetical protein